MAIEDDFSVAATGDIRYSGTNTNYTVIAFHRWLMDLADNAQASGNDILDITDTDPSQRSTDNIIKLLPPFNIDDTAASHLYDGSVIQGAGATEEIWDGIVCYAPAGTYLAIVQDAALVAPNFWTTSYNPDAANGISHRFMVKVRTGGADIDGRRLLGQTREFGKTYSEFKINGSNRGNNVLALAYADDLNNATEIATVAGWTTISNMEGYRLIDVNNDTTDEPYYSEWNRATYTINQLYERCKWLSRRGTASTLYGLNGELFRGPTHEIALTTPRSGTFSAFEEVTWTGGTGQMLAIDSTTAGTKMWIQLLTGAAPTNGQTITGDSTATATASGTATERPLSYPFLGASTGSALIGAYGIGLEKADLSALDKLFDLTNTQRNPPNIVQFTVGGLRSGEDRVLVGPASGGALQTAQLSLNTTLQGAAETAVVCSGAIPADTPTTGSIRVECDSGIYRLLSYTSWASATFTIPATDFQADHATAANDVFISYIDKLASGGAPGDLVGESFSVIYNANRDLFIRVRDAQVGTYGPIKTFEGTSQLGAAGGAITAIRTPDA